MTLSEAITTLMDYYLGPGNWVLTTNLPSWATDPAYDVTPLYNSMNTLLELIVAKLQSQTSLPNLFKVTLQDDLNSVEIQSGQIKMKWDLNKTILPKKITTTVNILPSSGILGTDEPTITPF